MEEIGAVYNSPSTIALYAMILLMCIGQLALLLRLRVEMRRDIKKMRANLGRMIEDVHNDVRSMRMHITGVYGRGADRTDDKEPVH